MIALKINDIKNFMGRLLIRESFDTFLLERLQVLTASELVLSGKRNKKWYDSDSWEQMEQNSWGDCYYMQWKELKSTVFHYIKGSQSPELMKISFKAAQSQVMSWLVDSGVIETYRTLKPDLFLQLRYEKGQLQLVTGIAFSQFQMDRTVEQAWDEAVRQFLRREQIAYEEE